MADNVLEVEARLIDNITKVMANISRNASLQFSKMQGNAKQFAGGLEGAAGKVVNLKNAVMGFAAVKFAEKTIFAVAKLGDEIDKTSQRIAVSTDFLQEMKHVMQLAGGSMGDIELSIKKLAKAASDADEGLETYKRAFDTLNISVTDSNGNLKSTEVLFGEVTTALAGVESETKKLALAQDLLGRGGLMMIPLMNQGADAIKNQREEARRLGGVMNTETIKAAVDFTDNITRLKTAVMGVGIEMFTPKLKALSDATGEALKPDNIEAMKSALDDLITSGKIFFGVYASSKILALTTSLSAMNVAFVVLAGTVYMVSHALNKAQEQINNKGTWADSAESIQKVIDAWYRLNDVRAQGRNNSIPEAELVVKLQQANDAFKQLTGYTKKEFEAMGFTEGKLLQMIDGYKAAAEAKAKFEEPKKGGGKKLTEKEQEEIYAIMDENLNKEMKRRLEFQAWKKEHRKIADDMAIADSIKTYETLKQIQSDVDQFNLTEEENKLKSLKFWEDERRKFLIQQGESTIQLDMAVAKQRERIADLELQNKRNATSEMNSVILGGLAQAAQGYKTFFGIYKLAASAEATVSTILSAQRIFEAFAKSTYLGPLALPAAVAGAATAGLAGFSRVAQINSQKMASGGYVGGRTYAEIGEAGPEYVLNARATAKEGVGNLNAMNSGQSINRSISNDIHYSPVFNISGGNSDSLKGALESNKDWFANFFKKEIVGKGYLKP